MLTCFNLKTDETIQEFQSALAELTAHLKSKNLLERVGPIGLRQTDTIMDTDDERDHQYFFIMTFADRAQCDRSVEYMYAGEAPVGTLHQHMYAQIKDPIFISWVDV
jgi:hypothetical protein